MSVTITVAEKTDRRLRSVKDAPELNVSNYNFSQLWQALGLEFDSEQGWVGHVYPQKLRAALASFNPANITRPVADDGPIIDCGLPPRQVDRYVSALNQIVEVAEKQENVVAWC